MKIAQIVCSFYPYRGGIGSVAQFFSEQLAAKGHQIDVITPAFKPVDTNNMVFPYNIKRVKPWLKYGNAGWLPLTKKILNQYDIVHLHYPFFGVHESIWCATLGKRDFKFVLTYHMDFIPKTIIQKVSAFPSKILLPKLVQAADTVTVSSFDYAENSLAGKVFWDNNKKYIEVPFGCDPDCYHDPVPSELRSELGVEPNDKVILFVGGLDQAHYFKGLNNLIEAVAGLDISYKLLIVGKGSLQSEYKALADKLGVSDKVKWQGRVSEQRLRELYNLADLTALPSINMGEAFGIVLVNAYACKTPVVASALPGVRTVVDDGETGFLVPPNDVPALRQAMNKILSDSSLQQIMGDKAFVKHAKIYNWPSVGNKVEALYQKIMSDN